MWLPGRIYLDTLRVRLMTLLGAIMLSILFVAGISVIGFTWRVEQAAWRDRQGEAARHAAQTVAAFIQRVEDTLILTALLGRDELEIQPQMMRQALERNPALLEVVYLDADGRVIASASQERLVLANLRTIPQSQWFVQARAGQHYQGSVQLSATSQPYLILALPAVEGRVIVARLNMDVLWHVVADIRFGQSGRAYVINRQGKIIAHTDPRMVLANATIAGRPELAAVLETPGYKWFGTYANLEGIAVVSATEQVAGTEWIVMTELPWSEAFAASRAAWLLLGGGLLVFLTLVTWLAHRLLVQSVFLPMEKLRAQAERIGQGDLNQRIGLSQPDEIGLVARAFDDMADRLNAQRVAVEQRTAELEALHRIGLGITSSLDPDIVMDLVLEAAFTLLPEIEDAHIFLYEADRLTFATSRWADGRRDVPIAEPRPDGLTYTVARTGEPMLIPDIRAHPLYADSPTAGHGALVGLPLKIGARVVGVMNVAYTEPRNLPETELRMMAMMGDQIAIAIENSRLYRQAQHELAERQQAEAALRESEQRYRLIAENAKDVIWIRDMQLRPIYTSPSVTWLRGYSVEEAMTQPLADTLTPASIELARQFLVEMLAEAAASTPERIARQSRSLELEMLRKDGSTVWTEVKMSFILGPDGKPTGILGVSRDITERKQAADALRQLNEALEDRVRARTAELATANRELQAEIAERRRIEAALRASETQLRHITDNMLDMIVQADDQGRYVYVSPSHKAALGYAPADLVGRSMFEYIHADDRAQAIQTAIAARAAATVTRAELRFRHAAGHYVWLETIGNPIFNDQGQMIGAIMGSRDITERRQAEEALRQRAEELAVLQATVLEINAPHQLSTLLQTIVERAAQLLGARSGGMYLCDPARQEARCVVSYNTPHDYTDTILKYGEGAAGTVAQTGKPLIIDDYRLWSKRAAVYEEDQPFTTVLSAPMISQNQVIGVIHVLDDMAGRRFTPADLTLLTLFASHAAIAVENTRLYEEAQNEITERKRTEAALRRAHDDLARSNTDLQQFAYVASHDLQEPLRMVASFVGLLAERYRGQLDADADEFIGFAVDGAKRMQRLINDLLEYSRVGTRGEPPQPTDANAALDDALWNLDLAITDAGATVTHDPLPTVLADPIQLAQLFQNLIGNAIKFRSDKPPAVHVAAQMGNAEYSALRTPHSAFTTPHWIFSVRDNGIGIDPQDHDRIFGVFQRLHTQQEYAGTGIGLAVCQRIVERHGGRIWVESQIGQGATFYFTLPTA
jgi:PAS domain S-box-containing protein